MEEKNINENNENPVEENTAPTSFEADNAENAQAEAECNGEVAEDELGESEALETASDIPQIEALEEIEEKQTDELEEATVSKVEPAAYAFRWDYNEQKLYDDSRKKKSAPSRGVATYVLILTVTFLLAVAALFGAILIGDKLSGGSAPREPMQYSDSLALDELYDYCLPSYVAISVVKEGGGEGAGSGIILTEDGYICTNYHVVEGAKKITAVVNGLKKLEAEYIDGDEVNDIAVIKVSASNLTPAKLGSSKNTKVGERVMAIGTPFSISYAGSMTAGYVSGIDRQYAVKNDNGTVNKILKLIQTDTSVNPGNSGGPLFNMNGEVIGVVTLKISGTNYEGMGFALPIDGVKNMIFDIIENGKITDSNAGSAVRGAALGISGHEIAENEKYFITEDKCFTVSNDSKGDYISYSTGIYVEKVYLTDTETLSALGIEDGYPFLAPATGVLVRSTSEGFDSHEKLKVDDIIMTANGISCNTMSALQEIIFDSRIGDVLNLEVFRDGQPISVDVTLGEANSME